MSQEKLINNALLVFTILTINLPASGPHQETKTTSSPLPAAKEELLGELSAETSIPGPDVARGRGLKAVFTPPEREPDYFIDPVTLRFAARAKQGKGWVLIVDGKERGSTLDGIESILISPRGQHVVYSAKKGKRWVKMLDDKELGPEFDKVGWGFWLFGETGLERYAYQAIRGQKWLMVVDGNEGPEFEDVGPPGFSERGPHLVFWAKRQRKHELIVLDGKEGPDYEEVRIPHISSDGQRLAYAAKRGKKWLVVADGKEGPLFAEINLVSFSPDGRHLAYAALTGRKEATEPGGLGTELWVMIVDGNKGPEFEAVSPPVFSPDGQHVAYRGMRTTYIGHRQVLMFDGKEAGESDFAGLARNMVTLRPEFDAAGQPVFSPDSRHWAYRAKREKKYLPIIDGKEGAGFSRWAAMWFASDFTFSPDSQRVAYVWGWGGDAFLRGETTRAHRQVVVDGHAGEVYDTLAIDLGFSPDSRHLVYSVRGGVSGDKSTVVTDGQEAKLYDDIIGGNFFPRQAQSDAGAAPMDFVYIAREGRKFFRVTQPLP